MSLGTRSPWPSQAPAAVINIPATPLTPPPLGGPIRYLEAITLVQRPRRAYRKRAAVAAAGGALMTESAAETASSPPPSARERAHSAAIPSSTAVVAAAASAIAAASSTASTGVRSVDASLTSRQADPAQHTGPTLHTPGAPSSPKRITPESHNSAASATALSSGGGGSSAGGGATGTAPVMPTFVAPAGPAPGIASLAAAAARASAALTVTGPGLPGDPSVASTASTGPAPALPPPQMQPRPLPLSMSLPAAATAAQTPGGPAVPASPPASASGTSFLTGGTPSAAPTPGAVGSASRSLLFSPATPADGDSDRAGGRGLRHFSLQVCERVQVRGRTTYNEVADDLVADYVSEHRDRTQAEHKNIRRRVYDALNVLMAMRIIVKERREIRWIGLPGEPSADELAALRRQHVEMEARVQHLASVCHELESQLAVMTALSRRNAQAPYADAPPTARIHTPFILVQTDPETGINCQTTEDQSEWSLDFTAPFELHNEMEVLQQLQAAGLLPAEPVAALTPAAALPPPATPTAPPSLLSALSVGGGGVRVKPEPPGTP